MKKIIFSAVLIVALLICASCVGTGVNSFSDAIGKDWKLIEVRTGASKDISFNRNTLSKEDAKDIFTMKIEAANISGIGASNRFSAPYTQKGQTIEIQPMRTTLMAPLRQPEKLKEHEFFIFLQSANEWKIVDKNLEFHSETEEGDKVVLVFSL